MTRRGEVGAPLKLEATAARTKRFAWMMYGGMAALYAAIGGLGAILPDAVMGVVTPILVLGALAGSALLVVRIARMPKVSLEIGPESIAVSGDRGGIYGYSGATLGVFRMAGFGVTAGTVLHLSGADRRFLIGGQDHRPSPSLRLEAAPTEEVDVTLPAADFDLLLDALPDAVFRARWDAPPTPAPLRVALLPNPSAAKSQLRVMLPWIGTIVACAVLAAIFDATGLDATPLGRTLQGPAFGAVVVTGLVLTIVRAARRKPGQEIEIDDREARLRDPSGRVIAAAPRPSFGVTAGVYRYQGKASFEQAVLTLRFSAGHEVAIGVFDMRFHRWEGAPVKRAPAWIVGGPDWDALVERLGVGEARILADAS
jgi:hypothetical protein